MTKLTKFAFAVTALGLSLGQLACKAESAAPEPAPAAKKALTLPPPVAEGASRRVEITVTEKGYEPSPIALRKGEPVELVITRVTDQTCATELILEEAGLDVKLPLNEAVTATFTPSKTGELRYGCAMGKMIAGVFSVQE